MLRILDHQMEALGRQAARGFVLRMARYLRESFQAETRAMTDEALLAWVDRTTKRAGASGVDTEPEVAQYLLLSLRLGEDAAERLPWFRASLSRKDPIAPGKVRALVRAARAAAVPDLDRFVMKAFAA